MAEPDPSEPEPSDGEDDLPDDAKRLVATFRKGVRDDVNSILDERMRVNEPDPKDEPDPEDEPDPPRSRSLAERLGFGAE